MRALALYDLLYTLPRTSIDLDRQKWMTKRTFGLLILHCIQKMGHTQPQENI